MIDLGDRLAELVGPQFVSRTPRELAAAGISSSMIDAPAWLVRPGAAAEIAQVVRMASDAGAQVIPVGTASRRGTTPRGRPRPRVVVDMKRMAHVVFLDETSLVAQVQAGITGIALEELLIPRGLTFGDFAPAALKSTLGGMLAVRTPGKASPRHGRVEDAVLGVSAVLADGRTIHTKVAPRRATGPDLARVILGSEGQLGIVTGIVLRIQRRPETRLLDAHGLPSLDAAVDAAREALARDARPAALRIYDAGEAAAHLGIETAGAVLVAATAGPPELAAVDREIIGGACARRGGTGLGTGPAEIWWRRRFGHTVPGAVPPPPVLEASAEASRIAQVYRAVAGAAEAGGVKARAHVARWGPDGACLFFTVLDGGKPITSVGVRGALEAAAREAGGHLIGERDPAFESYYEALREELDPRGVFRA